MTLLSLISKAKIYAIFILFCSHKTHIYLFSISLLMYVFNAYYIFNMYLHSISEF